MAGRRNKHAFAPSSTHSVTSDNMSAPAQTEQADRFVSIAPLLKRFSPAAANRNVTASEIALAVSHIFTNSLSADHAKELLIALHLTGWEQRPDVLAKCAEEMRDAAAKVDKNALRQVVRKRGRREGAYRGGLVR